MKSQQRIQFITCNRVKDSYGITSGLFNSASFVCNFLKDFGFDSKLNAVVDSNSIDKVVTEYDPDVVIIEALWVPPAKLKELLAIKRHSRRRWIIRVHSKAPFLANEGLATLWMKACIKIPGKIEIAPNTEELTEQLSAAFPEGKFTFLPNIYHPPVFKKMDIVNDPCELNIGCFGAIRPMKNTYQQALAAIAFAESKGKKLRFHINGTRAEQLGENSLKNIRALFDDSKHELVEHHWYKHKDFLNAISYMDIGMQVSFSESFNIVTADFVTAKIPIVASDDISWMPWFLKVSPTNHRGMLRKLNIAYDFKKISTWCQTIFLKIYNTKAQLTWIKELN
jgi:hypothetical protein